MFGRGLSFAGGEGLVSAPSKIAPAARNKICAARDFGKRLFPGLEKQDGFMGSVLSLWDSVCRARVLFLKLEHAPANTCAEHRLSGMRRPDRRSRRAEGAGPSAGCPDHEQK